MHPGDAPDNNRYLSALNPLDHHTNRSTHGNLSYPHSAHHYPLQEPPCDRPLKHARFVDKQHVQTASTYVLALAPCVPPWLVPLFTPFLLSPSPAPASAAAAAPGMPLNLPSRHRQLLLLRPF